MGIEDNANVPKIKLSAVIGRIGSSLVDAQVVAANGEKNVWTEVYGEGEVPASDLNDGGVFEPR